MEISRHVSRAASLGAPWTIPVTATVPALRVPKGTEAMGRCTLIIQRAYPLGYYPWPNGLSRYHHMTSCANSWALAWVRPCFWGSVAEDVQHGGNVALVGYRLTHEAVIHVGYHVLG